MPRKRIYRVKVKTPSGDYLGTFYSPYPDRRLSEVVARLDGYLNLKDVVLEQTGAKYPFVIINKESIEMIILMEETVAGDEEVETT